MIIHVPFDFGNAERLRIGRRDGKPGLATRQDLRAFVELAVSQVLAGEWEWPESVERSAS